MALIETQVIDKIEVVEDYNYIQSRTATRIHDTEILVGQTFHRHIISPLDNYSGKDAEIQALCNELHTQTVKDDYQIFLDNQGV